MAIFNTAAYNDWGENVREKLKERSLNLRVLLTEFVGMMWFVFIGCGTAVSFQSSRPSSFANADVNAEPTNIAGGAVPSTAIVINGTVLDEMTNNIVDVLKINASFGIITAMAFGMSIMVLVYSLGHISGAHLNPAITLSLVISGHTSIIHGVFYVLAQVLGSIMGALLLWGGLPGGRDTGLGANSLSPGITAGTAVLTEAVCTALLCFAVHMTLCDRRNKISPMAPLVIGFAVFLSHCVLIPIDGCSINPARSLGPAIVATKWHNFWVFVVGPFTGSIFGVIAWLLVSKPWNEDDVSEHKKLDTPQLDSPVPASRVESKPLDGSPDV